MLLAIDTATRFASVALYNESGILAEQSWRSANNHSVEMMPAVDAMLKRLQAGPQDLSALAVVKGPGSFTGLRIGMSLAKGLCLSLDLPIIGIPTLDVVAYAVGDPGGPILAVLEAGRRRLCVARYHFDQGMPVMEGELTLVRQDRWELETDEPILVVGEVPAEVVDRLLAQPNADLIGVSSLAGSLRRAGYLAELAWDRLAEGEIDDLDTLSPIYLHYPSSDNA